MADLEDLPLRALDNLLPRLDRESLKAASNVCVSWKKIVHDFTSRRISNVDSDLRDKLEKCGWIMSEHDVERCSCIELNSSLFKFIGNVPLSCRELFSTSANFYMQPIYALSKSKLFFSNDFNVVKVFDLKQKTMEPTEPWKGLWRCTKIEAMHSHDKTLALIEGDHYTLKKICILNHETSQFVHCLNENSFKRAMGLTQKDVYVGVRVLKIAMAEDKLAVLLVIEHGGSVSCQTQIWKLDTADPSTTNIRYWKTIEHDLNIDTSTYMFKCNMNSKLLMNSKLFCFANINLEQKKLVLNVLLFDDRSRQTVTVFEDVKGFSSIDHLFDVIIDDRCSKRVSVFDKTSFILRVFDFDAADVRCLEVNLSQYGKDSDGMLLKRFMMGKVMLLLRSDGKFKCILVTEDGVVIEGIEQQLQNEIHAFHVNADGIVAVTMKEFENYIYFYK